MSAPRRAVPRGPSLVGARIAGLALALVVAACGDDGSSVASAPTEVSPGATAPSTEAAASLAPLPRPDALTEASSGEATETPAADALIVRHAERFRFQRRRLPSGLEVVVLVVREPWREQGDGLRYLLVPRRSGLDLDAIDRDAVSGAGYDAMIEVPVERLATTSTTELGFVAVLGLEERWIAHSEPRFVSSSSLRRRIDTGAVANIGAGAGRVDPEQLLDARPEVLLADFMNRSQLDDLQPARAVGLAVVLAPAFLESTPLGRAEWVKVVGALTGHSAQAAELFDAVETAYDALRRRVDETVSPAARPVVLTGGPYDDVWHVPGGASYPARLLADAGAVYPWRDADTERALPLDVERVLERAGGADVWVWPSHWASRREILAADPRLVSFAALRTGAVWAADRRVNGLGGNDFWESGAARPDLVLADLVHILHPEVVPTHELVFHRRLGEARP